MTVIDAALADIFGNQDVAVMAAIRPATGDPYKVPVLKSTVTSRDFLSAGLDTTGTRIEVRVADAPALAAENRIAIGIDPLAAAWQDRDNEFWNGANILVIRRHPLDQHGLLYQLDTQPYDPPPPEEP